MTRPSSGRRCAWSITSPKKVAADIKCAERATFTLDGSRLVSPKVQAQQFASLCQLAPGTYSYRVALSEGPGARPGPERRLEGTITVIE